MSHRGGNTRPTKSSGRKVSDNRDTADVEYAGLTAYLAEDLNKYMRGSMPIAKSPYIPKSPAKRSLQAFLDGEKDADAEHRSASHRCSELLRLGNTLEVIPASHGVQRAHGSISSTQPMRHHGSLSNSRYELIQLRPQPLPLPLSIPQRAAANSSSIVDAQAATAPSFANAQAELQAYLSSGGEAGTDGTQIDVGADLGPPVGVPAVPPPTLLHLKQKPKRIRSTKGDDPMANWRLQFSRLVPTLMALEIDSRLDGGVSVPCYGCATESVTPNAGAYRCVDCASDELWCLDCIRSIHRRTPFHHMQMLVVRDDFRCFERATPKQVGLSLNLGHRGARCESSVVREMVVMDTNGIFTIDVNFCRCKPGADDLLFLLAARLFPATSEQPKTIFTFRCLELFDLLTVESKLTSYEFCATLARLTDNLIPTDVENRYPQFNNVHRLWAYWKDYKRTGGPFPGFNGDLSVSCPACPHPGVNLPDDWQTAPAHDAYIYYRYVAFDGNFKLTRFAIHGEKTDPPLRTGRAYCVEPVAYNAWLAANGSKDLFADTPTCSGFQQQALANGKGKAGVVVTGVGGGMCTRHEFILARSVVDFQKGERYSNMDYSVGSGLRPLKPYQILEPPSDTQASEPASTSAPTPVSTSVPMPASTSVPVLASTSVLVSASMSALVSASTSVPNPASTSVSVLASTSVAVLASTSALVSASTSVQTPASTSAPTPASTSVPVLASTTVPALASTSTSSLTRTTVPALASTSVSTQLPLHPRTESSISVTAASIAHSSTDLTITAPLPSSPPQSYQQSVHVIIRQYLATLRVTTWTSPGTTGMSSLQTIVISYDVICQWLKKLELRMISWPEEFQLREVRKIYAIPKAHLPAHKPACHGKYSLNYIFGMGRTDGEGIERGWSESNRCATSTRNMKAGARHDRLDHGWGDHNHKKRIGLGVLLRRRLLNALYDKRVMLEELELYEKQDRLDIARWKKDMDSWEAGTMEESPFQIRRKPGQSQSERELALKLKAREEDRNQERARDSSSTHQTGRDAADTVGAAQRRKGHVGFISAALAIAQQQVHVAKLSVNEAGTVSQQTALLDARTALQARINGWRKDQSTFMGGVMFAINELVEKHDDSTEDSLEPEDFLIVLPSSFSSTFHAEHGLEQLAAVELDLRLGAATDCLAGIRYQLRLAAATTHYSSRTFLHQHAQTRKAAKLASIDKEVKILADVYGVHRKALLSLGVKPDAAKELTKTDLAAMGEWVFGDPLQVGQKSRRISWIWLMEGIAEECANDEFAKEDIRVEYMRTLAAAHRFPEEVNLLKEEMRRTLAFLQYEEAVWLGRMLTTAGGLRAYALRQARGRQRLHGYFAGLWSIFDSSTLVDEALASMERKRNPTESRVQID